LGGIHALTLFSNQEPVKYAIVCRLKTLGTNAILIKFDFIVDRSMKRFLLILLIAVGCSKADVKPADALTGHWSFQSSSISGDFTILNTPNGYSLQPGGIFTIKGVSYTCDQFWIPLNNAGKVDIYLGSPMVNSSRDAMLIFSVNPATLQYGSLQPSSVIYELKNSKSVQVKEAFVLQKK